jgi:hypothetical protein
MTPLPTAPALPELQARDLPGILRRVPLDRSRDLLILRAGRRLTEAPPPVVAKAEELGRDAGRAAASQVFDGSTPDEAYQRVLRGTGDGDPAVLDAAGPPAIGPAAGYTEGGLARDLGIDPATAPCPAPCPPAPTPASAASGRKPSGPPATTPAKSRPGPAVQADWGRLASRGPPPDGLNHETRKKAAPGKVKAAREKTTAIRRCCGR